ncbi:MAG: hypothetical protein JWP23_2228, partial [Phenylobacterium sp.]|nr:hypothetical protein [Phenylobacterium sp.]
MKLSLLGAAVFATTLAGGLSAQGTALADPQGAVLTQASFLPYMFGGRQFCWYDSAWSGPGWYWCGYEWRNGLGWGGGRGWNGWHRGGRGGAHNGGGGGHTGLAGGHLNGGTHVGASGGQVAM